MSRWPSCRKKANSGARRSRSGRVISPSSSARCSRSASRSAWKRADSLLDPGWGFLLMTMLTLTTGSAFIMWLGEQITDRGVGNGMSLLIFAGIVVGLPRGVVDLIEKAKNAAWGAMTFPLMVGLDHLHDRGGGLHRVRGTQRAANSGAIRQTCRRTQGDGRAVDALAVARQRGRRHAGHLRVFDFDFAADHRLRPAQQPLFRRSDSAGWAGASRSTRCSMPSALFSSRTSTFRSCSIRAKSPTTCASMADLFPAFVPASALRISSTKF